MLVEAGLYIGPLAFTITTYYIINIHLLSAYVLEMVLGSCYITNPNWFLG